MKVKYFCAVLVFVCVLVLTGCGKTEPAKVETAPAMPETEAVKPATEPAVTETEPATPENQALQCYKDILSAAPAIEGEHPELQDASFDAEQNQAMFGNHYDQFVLVDLNQDGVPELIASSVINFRWVPISVFTYADGEAVLLTDPTEAAAHGTFEQCAVANGAYSTYLCSENHIHSLWRGNTPVGEQEENHAFALTGTALTAVDCTATEGTFFFDIAKPNTEQTLAALIP